MERRIITSFFLIFLIQPLYIPAKEKIKTEELDLVRVLPAKEEKVYFKTTPFIAVDDSGNVYAVDNRVHTVYKLDQSGRLIQKIGRKGQGPGDLELPSRICVDKDKVFVSDNRAISTFDIKGNFLNRFRKFRLITSIAVFQNTVLLAEPTSDRLISAYGFNGMKLNSFGQKYKIDYSIYNNWPKDHVDQMINRGKIVCSENFIFFISESFGDIFKYNEKGELMFMKKMEDIDFIENRRNLIFKAGGEINRKGYYVLKGKDLGYFINDAFYLKGKIYLLLSENYLLFSKGNMSNAEVWQIDEDSLEIEKKISFIITEKNKSNKIYPRGLAIRESENNNLLYYMSYYDDKKGDFLIGLFKKS